MEKIEKLLSKILDTVEHWLNVILRIKMAQIEKLDDIENFEYRPYED